MSPYQNPRSLNNTLKQLSTNLIGSWRRQKSRSKRIIVIVNPAAGQDRPILKTINSIMRAADVEWNLVITRGTGDGYRLARQAVASGADTVAVYGGDGTVAEVASGLSGSAVAMGIIPGGTSNFIATSLGISRDISQALSLIIDPTHSIYSMHLGLINRVFFIQLAGIGMDANMIEGAGREVKERFGLLAYGLSVLQSITNPQIAHYHMELDNKIVDAEGVTCLIANMDNLHMSTFSGTSLEPRSGLLDILIPKRVDMRAFFSIASLLAGGNLDLLKIPHWQARKIYIETDSPQLVQSDGEIIGHTPIRARVTNRQVRMIVSPQKAATLSNYDYVGEDEGDEEPAYGEDFDQEYYPDYIYETDPVLDPFQEEEKEISNIPMQRSPINSVEDKDRDTPKKPNLGNP